MTRGWMWPVGIVAALLFTVGVNVVMLMAASSDSNGSVVEADYYRKAVEWDRTLARREASARLGWTARATIGPSATVNGTAMRTVRLSMVDSLGAPVTGAMAVADLIHNRDAAHPVRVSLGEVSPSQYEALVPISRRGQWEMRVEVRRGDALFVTTLRTEAP